MKFEEKKCKKKKCKSCLIFSLLGTNYIQFPNLLGSLSSYVQPYYSYYLMGLIVFLLFKMFLDDWKHFNSIRKAKYTSPISGNMFI